MTDFEACIQLPKGSTSPLSIPSNLSFLLRKDLPKELPYRPSFPSPMCHVLSHHLFDGASMILTPYPTYGRAPLDKLEKLLKELGFARIVYTDPKHHDEMIAFTSQLCHLISSAYVREPLSKDHVGYSAGSFRDMARVGAPDPDTWTELFFANRDALLPILERYINRLDDFRGALAADDRARLHAALEDGVAAKAQFGKGLK